MTTMLIAAATEVFGEALDADRIRLDVSDTGAPHIEVLGTFADLADLIATFAVQAIAVTEDSRPGRDRATLLDHILGTISEAVMAE